MFSSYIITPRHWKEDSSCYVFFIWTPESLNFFFTDYKKAKSENEWIFCLLCHWFECTEAQTEGAAYFASDCKTGTCNNLKRKLHFWNYTNQNLCFPLTWLGLPLIQICCRVYKNMIALSKFLLLTWIKEL